MSNELVTVDYQGIELVFYGSEPLLTQAQMASMLGLSRDAVSIAIRRAMENGEFGEQPTTYSLSVIASDGKRRDVNHYTMDVFLLVAYRANHTPQAMAFRQWVASIVKREFMAEINRLQAHTEQLETALSEEQKERREADYWAFRDKEHALKMLAELRHSQPLENWE